MQKFTIFCGTKWKTSYLFISIFFVAEIQHEKKRSQCLPAGALINCRIKGRRVTIPEPRGKKSLENRKKYV